MAKQIKPMPVQRPAENSGKELLYVSNKSYNIGFRDGKREAEQKQEWSENDTAFLNEITDFFENKTVRLQHDLDMYAHWLKSLPERFNLEPKPEWSEEDEKMSEGFMHKLEVCDLLTNKEITWAKHRLNSLHPQPKPEWSEEDEDMLNSCISSIEEAKENRYAYKETDGDTSYDHEIAWLKSLRPVSKDSLQSWKPSEAHLSALLAIFNDPNNIGSQTCQLALTDLYEQLNKL